MHTRTMTLPRTATPIRSEARDKVVHDFRALVDGDGWDRLAPAIRERFAAKCAGALNRYHGTMHVVRCNPAGWLLAQVSRAFGTPLAPFAGTEVPTCVDVFDDARSGGIVWRRCYHFRGKAPVTVRSTKVVSDGGRLLECVGAGFGMFLKVYERHGALHFESTDYFWRLGGWTFVLPELLTPGTAHVVHADEGGGWFRFTMRITHPWLGETYFQDGVFREEAD